jgi:hypothetical protein
VQNYNSLGPLADTLFTRDGAPMNTCLRLTGKWHAMRNMLLAALLVLIAGYVTAKDEIALNPAHPDTYTVQRGYTLWDISSMFLKDPWYWPEIWQVNPQVQNPHLIYPGDVLSLVYMDGQPRIQLTRGPSGTERLSPSIRSEDLGDAITSIPFADIKPFLAGGTIMDKKEAESLPYVVALRDHLVAGAGHEIYVNGLGDEDAEGDSYFVLRLDDKLKDPETNKVLGYEVLYIGKSELRARGEPATMFLTDTDRETIRGDRIRKADLSLPMNYFPSAPKQEVNGQIISVVDGVSRIGQYQMVIINRGMEHGLTEGSVLSVWQKGRVVNDGGGKGSSSGYSGLGKKVTLPDTFAGNVMVIKAYDDISYALVMEAVSEMRVLDRIANP